MSLERTLPRPPKQQAVCARLLELAGRLGPGAKMPTALELRDEMGVSLATLNSAMKELEAQRVITRRHGVGIYVSDELHQKTIALLCDAGLLRAAGHSPFWDQLFETVRARATSHHELLEVHLVPRDKPADAPLQRGLTQEIRSGQISGIIGIGLVEGAVRWIEAQNVPFVSLFGPCFAPRSVSVTLDGEALMRLGVKTLLERGCQCIEIWAPVAPFTPKTNESDWEVEAATRVLEEFGLTGRAIVELNRHLLPEIGAQTSLSTQEQGFETAYRAFNRPRAQWPDGIVITNDTMTRGAFTALRTLGVEVGRDVTVVSHANKGVNSFSHVRQPYALLENDPAQMVETTFAQLETLMNGQTPSQFEFDLPPQLRLVDAAQPSTLENP